VTQKKVKPTPTPEIVVEFGRMVIAGMQIQRDLARQTEAKKRWAEQFASVPVWIKAKSTEELGEMWANHTDECLEYCDEIWWELIGRGRGDLCPI